MGWAFIMVGWQVGMGKGLSCGLGSSNFPLMSKAQEEDVISLSKARCMVLEKGKVEV